jgi:hypothetical protein
MNLKYTHESKYTLCPDGAGASTFRFFESLFLNSIPIVKKTNTTFDKIYNIFPCLVVNDWHNINEQFLDSNYNYFNNQLKMFNEKLFIYIMPIIYY